jgi:outer membrane protein assembly factor BamB
VGRADHAFYSSPAVCGNYVYAVGSRGNASRCFAWDIRTGQEVWSGGPSDFRVTFSSPVLYQGWIYCGEGLHHTPRARVLCLNPSFRDERSVAWQWSTASHVECTPVCVDGRVYVAAGDDGVYCFDADPAAPPEQRLRWHVPGDRLPDAETALVVRNDRVYVGLGFGGSAVVMLDADTGRELRRTVLPWPVFSPPAWFADGWLIGMGPGNLLTAAQAGPGEIRCLDPDTLQTRWSRTISASSLCAPAIRQEEAVVTIADGHVLVLNRQGEVVRQWKSPAPIAASPAVAEDMIYCVDQEGLLTGLDAERLSPVWQVALGPAGLYVSAPVVAQERIVVGTPAGLMCVGSPSTTTSSSGP